MRGLLLALAIAALCLAAEDKPTTLTGVINQEGEDYVIAETESMKPIATLQGVEFTTENFANFIGQTVKMRGTLITPKQGRKILRVRTLADIQRT